MFLLPILKRKIIMHACEKGGYLINIDPVENVIHACECGSYYCYNHTEATEWLKKKYPKCKECLSGRRHT
jgi:hypothetical protein